MSLSRRSFALLGGAAIALALVLTLAFAGQSTRTDAHAGNYLNFPGPNSGYLEVPDHADFTPSAITIEAWVYPRSISVWGADGFCPVVVGKGFLTSYGLFLCTAAPNFTNYVVRYYPAAGGNIDGSTVIPLFQWTHIAVTYDGATTNIYVNGVLDVMSTAVSGAIPDTNTPLRIGNDAEWDATLDGALDEVRIWRYARTIGQINTTMNLELTAGDDLVAAWNFTDGNGADNTGNGHDGATTGDLTITSATLATATVTPSPTPSPTLTPNGSETASPTPTQTPSGSATVTPTPTPTPVSGAFRKGDVDCDGQVTAADILPILGYSARLGYPAACEGTAPVAVPQGAFGNWLNAGDGTGGYVEIPYDPALNPQTITIEMMVNAYGWDTPNVSSCPSLLGNGFDEGYWLGLCGGHVVFRGRGSTEQVGSINPIPMREWTHIAVVADATSTKFYINGVQDGEFTNTLPLSTSTNPVRIAHNPGYPAGPRAAIDEVRIWNVTRSEGDIFANMDLEVGPAAESAGLVAGYHFNDNLDDVTTHHNGTAVGTLDIGNNLPEVNWHDLNCDGLIDMPDAFVALYDLAGLTYSGIPEFCEPIGTTIPTS